MQNQLIDIVPEDENSFQLPNEVFGADSSTISNSNSLFDPETYSLNDSSNDLANNNNNNNNHKENSNSNINDINIAFETETDGDGDGDEFPETIIDKDEMMETSDDQDILGSPHSSFSYDDTLSEKEIDGLTNCNIILEFPQLTFDNIQLLPFVDELNDWFGYKDLKHLESISKISNNISIDDLNLIKNDLLTYFNDNKSDGKLLYSLLNLSYLAMGSFNNVSNELDIKNNIFKNIIKMIECENLISLIIDLILFNANLLTDISNLESNINLIKQKIISNQFFFALTILFIIILSFNSGELNEYEKRTKLSNLFNEKNLMIELLKVIDKWKWISNNSDNDDPILIVESMNSKTSDSEKRKILAVTQFKIRNVLSLFNNLIIFQFGNLEHIQSTKDFLKFKFENKNSSNNSTDNDESETDKYDISSLDYEYYITELMSRYPTYSPPKYEISEIMEMITKNENQKVSSLINVDSLLINQHQHLKVNKHNLSSFNSDPPDIHIATPMPSPTLTPQHTGNTRNYSNISEFEHTSNEIKKKLYVTQSNFPNIYPTNNDIPKSIKSATNIFYHHVKDNFNTKQFTEVFENFIIKENGYSIKSNQNENENENEDNNNFIYSEKDIKENPMFEDEIRSLINVENFYKQGIPYFNSLIYIILKLLISNTIPTQQSVENGKTRQRTTFNSKDNDNKKPYISDKLTIFEKQKLEINRMKETMLKTLSSILLMLQKWFKLSHILKFEFFTTLLFDQDFLIYLFRYLDSNKIQANSNNSDFKDTKNLINNRIVYCDYKVLYYLEDYNFFLQCLKLSKNPNKEIEKIDEEENFNSIFETVENEKTVNPLSFILPFEPHNDKFTIVNPNKRCCIIMSNLLQSMYYTVSHFKIQRIYKLIGVRPTEILRFYLTLHNKLFYLPILKTIKLLSPFIGKKWRANNMDLISFVYLFYKVGLKDPWLNNFFNVGIEENTKRGFDNEVSLRSMIKFYNYNYYGDELSIQGFSKDRMEFMSEIEFLSGDFFSKECQDMGT